MASWQLQLKSKLVMTCFNHRYTISFCILKAFPTLESLLGLPGFFYASAAVNIIGAVGVFFLVPETRGLTITELVKLFEGEKEEEKKEEVNGKTNPTFEAD